MTTRYVIVGAGLSGHQAALELRRLSPAASVVLIGAERHLPYDRTPLSKAALNDDATQPTDFVLTGALNYAACNIDYRPGLTVVAVDRAARTVSTHDGQSFGYDRLLIATGSRPRELPGFGQSEPGTYLRILEDSLRLRSVLSRGGRLVVIGGGFIGLEVAAAARMRGCIVTVIEASDRLLARGMPGSLSDWALRQHRACGTDVRLSASVNHIAGLTGGGYEVTANGATIRADAVVVGIGIIPNTELAAASGLAVEDGIVVDVHCRTEDPNIFAAGEVTAHPNWPNGRLRRVESWRTSLDHGLAAARNMAGTPAPFDSVPWFWSDQFDQNIQSAGFPAEASHFATVEGSTENAWAQVGFDAAGAIVGAVAVNRGRDISLLKRSIRAGGLLPASLRLVESQAGAGRARGTA